LFFLGGKAGELKSEKVEDSGRSDKRKNKRITPTHRTLNASSETGPSSRVTSGTLLDDAAAATTRAALGGGVESLRGAEEKALIAVVLAIATATRPRCCGCCRCWDCCEVARRGARRRAREEARACIFEKAWTPWIRGNWVKRRELVNRSCKLSFCSSDHYLIFIATLNPKRFLVFISTPSQRDFHPIAMGLNPI